MSCGHHTADYDYYLPPDRIAQSPIEPRDHARLLVLDRVTGAVQHRYFYDLPDLLLPGDTLIANQSRVIPARVFARKPTGGRVELLLLRRDAAGWWEALIKPARRLRPGTVLAIEAPSAELGLRVRPHSNPLAEAEGNSGLDFGSEGRPTLPGEGMLVTLGERGPAGIWSVRFSDEGALDRFGQVPLPPYIKRQPHDPERYQTVYAHQPGSAAAPTAGLHFTPDLLATLRDRGHAIGFVTLHIGLDTFRPVEAEETAAHPIHSEWCELPPETADLINQTRARGGRVVAVGTTTVRVLETAGGRSRAVGETWESTAASRQTGRDMRKSGAASPPQPVEPFAGPTRLFIRPGFTFRVVDALITNFHLPRSSLLFLVSALAGREHILSAYRTAIAEGYRFYSFGDAMLIA